MAFAALALAGCSSQEEANQQGEDLKAYVFDAAVAACVQQADLAAQAGLETKDALLDGEFAKACECGIDKVFKDIPAGDFAAITGEEDAAAFMAKLQSPADKAVKECMAELASGAV
ncbi:hypothetical protein ASD76_15775 [Altererythrobacter sp. Root672]|nr:hypothetical protein ASD76_15775 [Altererythrobacter sp. Root672]